MKKVLLFGTVGLLGLCLIIVVGTALSGGGNTGAKPASGGTTQEQPAEEPKEQEAAKTVTYKVTTNNRVPKSSGGEGIVEATYDNGKGGTVTEKIRKASWEKTIELPDSGMFDMVTLTVQSQSPSESSTVTCEVSADGQQIDQAESSGAYSIAMCSGTMP